MVCLCFVRVHHCKNIYYNYRLSGTAELESIHPSACVCVCVFLNCAVILLPCIEDVSSEKRADLIGELFNVVGFHCNEQDLSSFCSLQMREVSVE